MRHNNGGFSFLKAFVHWSVKIKDQSASKRRTTKSTTVVMVNHVVSADSNGKYPKQHVIQNKKTKTPHEG